MTAGGTVRALGLLCLSLVGLAGCGGGVLAPIESVETQRPPAARSGPAKRAERGHTAPRPAAHVVRRGETLYSIAFRHGLDYRTVAAWNRVPPPFVIYPGQRLRLRPPARPTPAPRVAAGGAAPSAPAKDGAPRPVESSPARAAGVDDPLDDRHLDGWNWPVRGPVIAGFAKSGGKGIDIGGARGEPVYSASTGRVVYAGGGLIGYGELIIVKHNKRFLTAYAHNDELLVREGDTVNRGQRIASMGDTGTDQVKLHFEIRRDGKPVNPLRYLPK